MAPWKAVSLKKLATVTTPPQNLSRERRRKTLENDATVSGDSKIINVNDYLGLLEELPRKTEKRKI